MINISYKQKKTTKRFQNKIIIKIIQHPSVTFIIFSQSKRNVVCYQNNLANSVASLAFYV